MRYIQDMEDFLRNNQQENLLGRAQIVAAVLQGQTELFKPRGIHPTSTLSPSILPTSHIYVRPLHGPIQLDGYLDDWMEYQGRMQFSSPDINTTDNTATLDYISHIGTYRNYLYVAFQVTDNNIVYRKPNSLSLIKNDHLKITLRDKQGDLQHYIIATQSPGWVNAHRMQDNTEQARAIATELRIKGEWQQTDIGYNIEIRIPLTMIGDNLSFFIYDVNDVQSRKIESYKGSSVSQDIPGTIIIPSSNLESILTRIARPASRTWVIDKYNRVLAVTGELTENEDTELYRQQIPDNDAGFINGMIRLLYHFLLQQPVQEFVDDRSTASRLLGASFQTALAGNPATAWRESPDKRLRILTATYPVQVNGITVGAIAIEETSNAILILQNRTMEILINLSLLAFFIVVLVLLGYATRLSFRIRHLRNQAEQAIGTDGRILNRFIRSESKDEIGDLSRSFSDMLLRISEYNRYLESMASKLSHELRTPIAVVRSSLDNLETLDESESKQTYLVRARDGMSRLSDILTRMSEATRLEQTLQTETCQVIDLSHLVANCIEAYRVAYADTQFEINSNATCMIYAADDLIVQMLDKLISNAVDFHTAGTKININVSQTSDSVILRVINYGPLLPNEMQGNLFESMVSVRDKRGSTPHLGLGLYIVRLIVEYHKGIISALNRPDNDGVEMRILFPRIK